LELGLGVEQLEGGWPGGRYHRRYVDWLSIEIIISRDKVTLLLSLTTRKNREPGLVHLCGDV
jgi:hypothetical protein